MGVRIFSSVNRGWLERLWLSGCTTYVQTYSPCRCYLCWVIRCYQRYVSTTWIHLNLCQYCISVISTKSPLFEVQSKSWLNEFDSYPYLKRFRTDFDTPKITWVPRSFLFHGHLCPGHLFFTHRHGYLGLGLHRVPGGRCRGGRTSCGGSALSGHGWRQRQAPGPGEGWEGCQQNGWVFFWCTKMNFHFGFGCLIVAFGFGFDVFFLMECVLCVCWKVRRTHVLWWN